MTTTGYYVDFRAVTRDGTQLWEVSAYWDDGTCAHASTLPTLREALSCAQSVRTYMNHLIEQGSTQ